MQLSSRSLAKSQNLVQFVMDLLLPRYDYTAMLATAAGPTMVTAVAFSRYIFKLIIRQVN